eukprot:s951_g14.t1
MAEAQAMVQAVQQAAQAAADAAQALRAVGIPKASGFAEANKTIQAPKEFGSAISSEDAANWTDFAFSFRQWLCFAGDGYSSDLQYIDEHGDALVNFKDTPAGLASKSRSTKLYAILSGVLKNRPLKVLRQVPNNNGLEVWRQLNSLFNPRTKVRSMAILSAIMGLPAFVKERSMIEQVASLERLADEYRKASGKDVSEDILLTTLVRVLPKQIQQHIQLGMTDSSTFQEVKDKVLAYERVSASWSRDKVLFECGATSLGTVTSYAAADSGPGPMEVNMVSKGKGKKGKGDKGKSKGKGPADKGKGKGKSPDKGKGKGQQWQKGQQKGYASGYNSGQPQQRAKLDSNVCAYCGKTGHWAKECRKKMADQQQQQVRLVGSDGSETKQDTTHSTAGSVSTGAGSQAVRLVQFSPHVEDLTAHSCPTSPAGSPSRARMISSVFDMSSTDDDGSWTVSPFCKHVRAVSNVDDDTQHGVACEIILDSGADTSALPLRFGQVGVEDVMPGTSFVDAQGTPLNVTGSRIAHVAFGDVVFKERFIISDITSPLLALGSVLRSGWSIIHEGGTPYLVKDDRKVEVLFRNNSLCAKGHIQVVTQAPMLYQPAIRVVQLSRLVSWMTGKRTVIWLYTDGSGARGILQRRGVGRLRHLSCRVLWLQALVETGAVKLSAIAGSLNPADVGTKRLPAPRLRSLMSTLGMFNVETGNLEGADDPGGIYKKRGNVVGQIATILSVLSLHQLKGCQGDHDDDGTSTSSLVIFTLVLGFVVLAVCRFMGFLQQHVQLRDDDVEPDAEPAHGQGRASPAWRIVSETAVHSEHMEDVEMVHDPTAASSTSIADEARMQLAFAIPSTARDMPTPEGLLRWLLARCRRRLDNSGLNLERRNLYLERIEVLRGLQSALENPLFRRSVMRNMAEMAAISSDEDSPNYRNPNEPVSLAETQRAHNFFMTLRGRAGSQHVDAVARALMRNEDYGPGDNSHGDPAVNSDEDMETQSEVQRRYYQSTQDQVSDPDLWAYLHYGKFTDDDNEETEGT